MTIDGLRPNVSLRFFPAVNLDSAARVVWVTVTSIKIKMVIALLDGSPTEPVAMKGATGNHRELTFVVPTRIGGAAVSGTRVPTIVYSKG